MLSDHATSDCPEPGATSLVGDLWNRALWADQARRGPTSVGRFREGRRPPRKPPPTARARRGAAIRKAAQRPLLPSAGVTGATRLMPPGSRHHARAKKGRPEGALLATRWMASYLVSALLVITRPLPSTRTSPESWTMRWAWARMVSNWALER